MAGTKAGGATRRWSTERVQTFFDTLAECCNVAEAERAAGMGVRSSYSRRSRDPEFRARWAEAIVQGYEKLELAAMERALNGELKPVRNRDHAVVDHDLHYSEKLILTLLSAHRQHARSVLPVIEDREAAKRALAERIAEARRKFGDE